VLEEKGDDEEFDLLQEEKKGDEDELALVLEEKGDDEELDVAGREEEKLVGQSRRLFVSWTRLKDILRRNTNQMDLLPKGIISRRNTDKVDPRMKDILRRKANQINLLLDILQRKTRSGVSAFEGCPEKKHRIR
jgi:hypothetical protein